MSGDDEMVDELRERVDPLSQRAADRIEALTKQFERGTAAGQDIVDQARAQALREAAEWHRMQHDSWMATTEKITGDVSYRALATERAEQHGIAEKHFRAAAEHARESVRLRDGPLWDEEYGVWL